jgi:hypothetical protein
MQPAKCGAGSTSAPHDAPVDARADEERGDPV